MSSLRVIEPALDERWVTPARLSKIVGYRGEHAIVDPIIGPTADVADPEGAFLEQLRFIDAAVHKIESLLDGRMLYRQGYRSWQRGSDQLTQELEQWPVEREALLVGGLDTGYRLNDDRRVYSDRLFNATRHGSPITGQPRAGTELENVRVDYVAGYLMPGQIALWGPGLEYKPNESTSVSATFAALPAQGSWVRPSDPLNRLRFECTVAGTSAGAEPTWPTAESWEPERVYAAGAYVVATDDPIQLWFTTAAGGTSGEREPPWTLTVGEDTPVDGTVTWTTAEELTFPEPATTIVWTGHFTEELPVLLQDMAALIAIELLKKVIGAPCKVEDEVASMMMLIKALRFATS